MASMATGRIVRFQHLHIFTVLACFGGCSNSKAKLNAGDAGTADASQTDAASPDAMPPPIPSPATPCAAGEAAPLATDSRLAFLADADIDGIRELFLVNPEVMDAPTPIRIHTPITDGVGIRFYQWSPDRKKILYVVDRPLVDDDDLYMVDLSSDTPGPPQRVSEPDETGANPAWSSDSTMIAYNGEDPELGATLKVSTIVGGVPQPGVPVTTSELFVGSFSRGFLWSPCRSELVFAAAKDGGYELFYVDLSGPDPTDPVPIAEGAADGDVYENSNTSIGYRWSPDGQKIAYKSDQGVDGLGGLYVVDVSGALPARPRMVNGALRSPSVGDFAWAPTGQYLAFRAVQDTNFPDLYVADVSGARPELSHRLSDEVGVGREFLWAPDGSSISFLSAPDGNRELFFAKVSATSVGPPMRINATLPGGGEVVGSTFDQYSYQYSPDGKWLAYLAEQDENNVVELYVADISGASPLSPKKVNGELVDVGDVSSPFWWSPDSNFILYRAIQDTLGVEELYLVDLGSPGTAQKVSGTLTPGGNVEQPFAGDFTYGWAPDENLIAFRADAITDQAFELFAVEPAVSLDRIKISMDLVLPFSVSDLYSFAWAPRLFLKHEEACEPGLPWSCASGLVCREPMQGGGPTCVVPVCEDGEDNDGDGLYDYPWDPGCASPKDHNEKDPPMVPHCANGKDDDGDGVADFLGGDPGCQSASDSAEADECVAGVTLFDHPGGTIAGSTKGGSSLLGGPAFCETSATAASKERVYRFVNDKGLITLTFSTAGSALDTVLYLRKVDDCGEYGPPEHCHDDVSDDEDNPDLTSLLTLEYPSAGTYYVVVDGKGEDAEGAFELTITGEIPLGEPCDPADTNFVCQVGLTCSGGKCSD